MSISKHQFLICPLLPYSTCTHNKLLLLHLTKYAPGADLLIHTGDLPRLCLSSYVSIRDVGVLLTLQVSICNEGKPFECILRSLRGLQGLVGR